MSVDPAVSRFHLEEELKDMEAIAQTYGWRIQVNLEALFVQVTLNAHTGEAFIVEAICDDYKELPPLLDFRHAGTGELGVASAYPRTNDSFFHSSGPCICAPFSRKAYKSFLPGAPHGDWTYGSWMTSNASGVKWENYSKLAGMFGLIQTRLLRPELYLGRMG